MSRSARLALAALVVNLGVILLGAVVRATGSGAGCGRSWPTCQGEILPELAGATAVEYAHRSASGLALLVVAALVVSVFRSSPRGHPARAGAVLSAVAIVGEALIGAAIVLFEWVADDASVARAVSVPLHLVNTLLLLAALTLTLFWASGGGRLRPSLRPGVARTLALVGAGMLLIGATGAITALADTLFPKGGVVAGGSSGEEHFLTRLRLVHPVAAALIGAGAAWWASARALPLAGPPGRAARWVVVLVGLALAAGVLNVALAAPVWMQVVHLALADLLWVAWVWLGATLLEEGRAMADAHRGIRPAAAG